MRELSNTLLAAQKAAPPINALVKLVLTYGEDSYTYTKSQIIDIKETGNGPLQSLTVILNNADKDLTGIDLQGYEGVLSYGANKEYSDCPPMWVLAQEFDSDPNKLTCTLSLVGICNLMAQDEAMLKYMPEEDDTKSVKTLVNEIASNDLDSFAHCQEYEVVWEEGYDDLADSYEPKDAFRVYPGNNRLSAINRLLDYTKNVMVAKADGKLHIFNPTTSGEAYDYTYSLQKPDHTFFAKALRNRLTIPNHIRVYSREDDDPSYSGYATDEESYARLPKTEFKFTYLESNDQATAIAEAILAKAQMWCEAGAANVPLNMGAEVYDYVRVVDSREKDERAGNIGRFTRHYNITKNEWSMGFAFGDWQNVRKVLANLNITGDDIENYFSRLSVKDAYIENLLAKNMGFQWIDPDNTIDLSKIGDNLDNLPDGEQYLRVSSWNLSLDEDPESPTYGLFILKMDEHVVYQPGYNPTTKFDLDQDTLDKIADGEQFRRVRGYSLSAAGLVLLDQVEVGDTYDLVLKTDISQGHILLSKTEKDGAWYDESGVGIHADRGIGIYGGEGLMGLKTYPTLQDYLDDINVQCYVGTDGKIYTGGGDVILDSSGITIIGELLHLKHTGGLSRGVIGGLSDKLYIGTDLDGIELRIYSHEDLILNTGDSDKHVLVNTAIRPQISASFTIGTQSYPFYGGYYSDRFKIPVGTDKYD